MGRVGLRPPGDERPKRWWHPVGDLLTCPVCGRQYRSRMGIETTGCSTTCRERRLQSLPTKTPRG